MENYELDEEFYKSFYPDLRNLTSDECLEHYNNHGKHEKRVSCQNELEDIIENNLSKIDSQKNNLEKFVYKKIENKFNILIRTSMRPELFETCINSILNQNYSNYSIYICYDKPECIDYLKSYETNSKISFFFISNDSTEKYKFNLYNNELMERVSDGFIIFIDDDDIFTHNMCLKFINEYINDEDSVILWSFMKPDKLVYPNDIDNIKIGDIDTTCVCFNNKHKGLSKWPDKQCGDYYFYTEMFKKLKEMNNLKIFKSDYILTKTIYYDKLCNSQ